MALLPRSAPPETEEHGETLAAPEPSVPPAVREEANPVSGLQEQEPASGFQEEGAASSLPSSPREGESLVGAEEEKTVPAPSILGVSETSPNPEGPPLAPAPEGPASRSDEAFHPRETSRLREEGSPVPADEGAREGEDEHPGEHPKEASVHAHSDAVPPEPSDDGAALSVLLPQETAAPAAQDPDLEASRERDARLTERLRRVTQMRREAREAARREEAPKRRARLIALAAAAVLLLGTAFALYRHIQRNSKSFIAQEAQGLYDEERYDEAMASYQRGFERYPDSPDFLLGLARSSEKAGQTEQSLTTWRLYLNQIPEDETANRSQALYKIGRLYALTRMPDKAIESLIQASNLDATHYDTSFVLGRLLEEQNRPAEALSAYRRALELRPSSPEAADAVKRVAGLIAPSPQPEADDSGREYARHLEVGTVALNLKRYDDALSHFNQALSIKSDDERPWLGAAGAYQGKGQNAEALKFLQDAQKSVSRSVTLEAKIDELEQSLKKAAPPAPAKRRRRTTVKR